MNKEFSDSGQADDDHLWRFARQMANNRGRIGQLRRYATEGFAEVFNRAPFLINVNEPDQPGYVPDPQSPCGVKFIDRQSWLPEAERIETRPAAEPVVESLFLIGSSGSVGHNASSDLDYWVCYDPASLNGRRLKLFQRKLAGISRWARECHQTEANFYTVNLRDLLQGRLTRLDDAETEGEVAPLLLLEELYRTVLYVAGRKPVWQGLPITDAETYRALSRTLVEGPDSEYVDLGFPTLPEPQEVLAAALWLARKSEADPFKGILKIVALLDYAESDFTRELLCNQVKEAIFSARAEQLPVDPYIMTIDRVLDYGAARLTPVQLDLLRIASALKVIGSGGGPAAFAMPENSPKWRLLEKWAEDWGWDQGRVTRLADYSAWPQREKLALSGDLLNMLTSVYIRIARHLMTAHPGRVNPQDEELAPLAARLLARMGGLDSTVETLPSKIDRASFSENLVFCREEQGGLWHLHAVSGENEAADGDNRIYTCRRAFKAAAWLVNNSIPRARLKVRPEGLLAPDQLMKLMDLIAETFPPFELNHSQLDDLWSPGGRGQVLAALNFEDQAAAELLTVDFVIRTGWGEMRHYLVDVAEEGGLADKYLKVIQAILNECGQRVRAENMVFFEPPSSRLGRAVMNIKGGLTAAAKKRRPGGPGKSRIDM